MNLDKVTSEQNISSNSDFQSSCVQTVPKVCLNSLSNEDMISRQQIQVQDVQETRNTMESLCRSFRKKYAETSLIFEPGSLAAQFNAKLRRVYDMTNILEGGGIIQKVEKGSYKWKGNFCCNSSQNGMSKNDWCSLRNISSQLRHLLLSIPKGLTCHDLYSILTSKKINKFNPSTIRRRIYECCKVFTLFGSVQKAGKYFYNGQLKQKDIQHLIRERIKQQQNKIQNGRGSYIQNKQDGHIQNRQNGHIQNRQQGQRQYMVSEKLQITDKTKGNEQTSHDKQKSQTNLTNFESRKSIIRNIVNQLKTQQDLHSFVQELNLEFRLKAATVDSQSLQNYFRQEVESSSQFYEEHTRMQRDRIHKETQLSPNLQRNIIVTSPINKQHSFLVGKNSSFCSFSSISAFQTFPNYKRTQDVRSV